MPCGYGEGKPAELPDDPIETDTVESGQQNHQRPTSATKPVSKGGLLKTKEAKHSQHATTGNVEEKYTIGLPFAETRTALSGNSVLHGPHKPRDSLDRAPKTYGSSPNTSRKRPEIAGFERLRADSAKRPKPIEAPSSKSDDEEGIAMNGRQGLKRRPPTAKTNNPPESIDLSSDDDQHSSPFFPRKLEQGGVGAKVHATTNYTNSVEKPRSMKSKKNSLLSRRERPKTWELSAFQRGIQQVDSEDGGSPIKLVITTEHDATTHKAKCGGIKVVRDGDEWPIPHERIISVLRGPESFGLKLKERGSDALGFFALAQLDDMNAVEETCRTIDLNVEVVTEKKMLAHCNNMREWAKRANVPLVHDPSAAEAKQQQEERDRKFAQALQQSERRPTRSRPVPTVEITKKPTKPKLSKPVSVEIAAVETAAVETPAVETAAKRTRAVSLQDSDEEEAIPRKQPRLAPKPKPKLPQRWSRPLLYPYDGPRRQNVDWEDLKRLLPEEFLNDNIINFYLRYLEENLKEKNPSLSEQTHFFNTFLYERLSRKGDRALNIESVMKWTAKIDLFKKNYIIVPINEASHWYLAIICNLQHLERRLDKDSTANDSDTTIGDEAVSADNNASPLSGDGSSVVNHTRSDKMDTSSDKEPEVAETRHNLESMTVEEGGTQKEWPSEDEVERLDEKQEHKNQQYSKLVEIPTSSANTVEGDSHEISDQKSPKQTKGSRKSTHYAPPNTPAIIILDSMGASRKAAVSRLKEWLVVEASKKRGLQITKDDLKGNHAKVPVQNNYYDCGLFVLHYIEVFLEHAESFVESLLARDNAMKDDVWREEEIATKRIMLTDLICQLHTEYEERLGPLKTKANSKAKPKPRAEHVGGTGPSNNGKAESHEMSVDSPGAQIINEANDAEPAPSVEVEPSLDAVMLALGNKAQETNGAEAAPQAQIEPSEEEDQDASDIKAIPLAQIEPPEATAIAAMASYSRPMSMEIDSEEQRHMKIEIDDESQPMEEIPGRQEDKNEEDADSSSSDTVIVKTGGLRAYWAQERPSPEI